MGKTLFGQKRFIFLNRLGLNLDHLQAGSRRVDPAFSQMGNNLTPKIYFRQIFQEKNCRKWEKLFSRNFQDL